LFKERKIINDPPYGFITIPSKIIYDLVEEPVFQRLRRIRQLGLTDMVYPGALHTRFHHALGAMHLMQKVLDTFRRKGHYIYDAEAEAALIAILLHDIGHGPFSHTMEYTLLKGTPHEDLSLVIMENLNKKYKGALSLAIEIFKGSYHRKFFHELVSSQLDMDRLDYLKRDSYFTGVIEGSTGTERIIQMMNVVDDRLVVEEKGIYSIESFLNARRLMYWQVYLHKTAICAERMLKNVLKRAKHLIRTGVIIQVPDALKLFLNQDIKTKDFRDNPDVLEAFSLLDDYDIWSSLKIWINHEDVILSTLSTALINRKLFQIRIMEDSPKEEEVNKLKALTSETYGINTKDADYFVSTDSMSNAAYIFEGTNIMILRKSGEVIEITKAADLPNIMAMSKIVRKYYLCWPKNISL